MSYCSWSPDDTYILTASSDYTVRLWNTRNAIHIRTFSVHTDSVSAVAFLPCGRKFLSGSVDKSLILWSISGEVLHRFPGARITDLALAPDGSTCVAVCHEKKLRIYDLALLTHRVVAQESEGITSVQIDASAQFVILNLSSQVSSPFYIFFVLVFSFCDLVWVYQLDFPVARYLDAVPNVQFTCTFKLRLERLRYSPRLPLICAFTLNPKSLQISAQFTSNGTQPAPRKRIRVTNDIDTQEIHLWDLTLNRLVRKFTGQKQGRFVIRSTFGGFSQNLIMSGSEDGIVYVWNRDTGTLIEKLPGHDGCVNCVSWGSDGRWASASDDKTVKM